MATVIAVDSNIDMDLLNQATFDIFEFGDVLVANSTILSVGYAEEDGNERLTFTGSFGGYSDGYPTTGTINSVQYIAFGTNMGEVSGLAYPVAQFRAFILAEDYDGLFRSVFGGDDTLIGSAFSDSLVGYGGNDLLLGGGGMDRMTGGLGDDTYTVDEYMDQAIEAPGEGYDRVESSASYKLPVYVERLELIGTASIFGEGNDGPNLIIGNAGDNQLVGYGGNDILDGGAGTDYLYGGPHNDLYAVRDSTDFVIESGFESDIDQVTAWISYTLPAGVEILVLRPGEGSIDGTGNAGANTLVGNEGNNRLDGRGGFDLFEGGGGDDTYVISADYRMIEESPGGGTDTVEMDVSYRLLGELENLTLTGDQPADGWGNGKDNVLIGNSAANVLDGETGADTMRGGSGDDGYVADDVGDKVVEALAGGSDEVFASVDYVLGGNLENLTLQNGATDGTGNGLANRILGNGADNLLIGKGGDDLLDGRTGADTMRGGGGDDVFTVDFSGDLAIEGTNSGTDEVLSSVSYELGGHVEKLTLTGIAAIDGTGNGLDNIITGNDSANRLDGRRGADEMIGGGGNDVYVVDEAEDTAIEEAGGGGNDRVESWVSHKLGEELETLALLGTASIDGTGNAKRNLITGNDSANRLDGGAGTDSLQGGDGNDVYIVDKADDRTIESSQFGGIDQVISSVSHTLEVNLENLTLTGSAISGTGNASRNRITGNNAANRLDGRAGGDVLIGGFGNDTYVVNSLYDIVIESNIAGGFDTVRSGVTLTLGGNIENLVLTGVQAIGGVGNSLRNSITGNAAANVLDGGAGADTMRGNGGDDVYVVDGRGDKVIETSATGGNDQVLSFVTYALSANLEALALRGTEEINGTGNALDNLITGNKAANVLNGAGGADTMTGWAGNDVYIVDNSGDRATESSSSGGNDEVRSAVTFKIGRNVEKLTLTGSDAIDGTGNGLDNVIAGNGAANRLNGAGGADTMRGNGGNDLYFVNDVGDAAVETSATGGAADEVSSKVSFDLGAYVENLTFTGTSAVDGFGNGLDNVLRGNRGANTLKGWNGEDELIGGGGNDQLFGGKGADRLTGGGGRDGFRFDAALGPDNVDAILDFVRADDTFYLDRDVFTAVGGGTLAASAFRAGASALDADDRILYDAATGNIAYDADGSGGGAAMLFATVAAGTVLTNADFVGYI